MGKHVPRIYIEPTPAGDTLEIRGQDFQHICEVLRLRVENELIIFNEINGEWRCRITEVSKQYLKVKIIDQMKMFLPSNKIKLAFGILKHDSVRILVEKCTEFGVTDFFPIITDYTNNFLKKEKVLSYIKSATEQCSRLDKPVLHETQTFRNFMDTENMEKWFSCIERSAELLSLSSFNLQTDCGFIIGPEGGFSDNEKKILLEKTQCTTLSNNVLRSETAAMFCVGICSLQRLNSEPRNKIT